MQNGAPKGSPLGEDDLENFYKRNLTRFVMVALGSRGAPEGLPKFSLFFNLIFLFVPLCF